MPTDNTPQEESAPQHTVDMSNIFVKFDGDALLAKLRELDVLNQHNEKIVKLVRNQLLNQTDWTQTVDAPLAPEVKQTFAEYRQELRDITAHPDYPDNVTLPPIPPTK
jgi:hypothetical protein